MSSMRFGPVELSVPPGFQNILHLISQEVLREKPANTMEFIAGYLDDLLAIREASGYDPVTHSELIKRVQEQYWKIVKMGKTSNLSDKEVTEKAAKGPPEVADASGDIAAPASVEDNAEVLVIIAMHQDSGEGTENCQPRNEDLKNSDKDMGGEPQPVAEQPEAVTEQPVPTPDVQKQGVGSLEDTTEKEGEQGENLEGQDEGTEDTAEQVAMATEEKAVMVTEEGETPAETEEVDEKNKTE